MDKLVELAQVAIPAGGKRGELGALGNGFCPLFQDGRQAARPKHIGSNLVDRSKLVFYQRVHKSCRQEDFGLHMLDKFTYRRWPFPTLHGLAAGVSPVL